jgi:hypothetical protein
MVCINGDQLIHDPEVITQEIQSQNRSQKVEPSTMALEVLLDKVNNKNPKQLTLQDKNLPYPIAGMQSSEERLGDQLLHQMSKFNHSLRSLYEMKRTPTK